MQRLDRINIFIVFLQIRTIGEAVGFPWDANSVPYRFLPFASDASVFKSGVRESGNLPNKFPSAKAGSALTLLCPTAAGCTPAIRASSVSKCEIARRFGSLVSR